MSMCQQTDYSIEATNATVWPIGLEAVHVIHPEENDEERQAREDAYNADDFARDYPNGEPPY